MNLSLTLNSTPSLSGGITIKSPQELHSMRQAGHVVAETVAILIRSVEQGMRTKDLDAIASQHIARLGAKPSFKGYRGFPATICTSINEQIVHGIPGNQVIQDGDIVSMDVGAIIDGYHADSAVTVGVGKVTPEAQQLIETTRTPWRGASSRRGLATALATSPGRYRTMPSL